MFLVVGIGPASAQQLIPYTNTENNSNAIIITGPLNPTTLEVDNTDSATQSGDISESGTSGAIIKDGSGTLLLSGSNSYSGGTEISTGILQADTNNAFGTGAVTVYSGATLNLSNTVTVANNITISGTGTSGQGAIYNVGSGGERVTGTLTLAADATVGTASGGTGILGQVDLQSNTLTIGTGSGTFHLAGTITGPGGLDINSSAGVTINRGNNIFNGTTDVLSHGLLILADSAGTAIPGNLTIEDHAIVEDNGTGQLSAAMTMTLNGNGKFDFTGETVNTTETIAGLESASTSSTIEASLAGPGTSTNLTLSGSGTYTDAGLITDYIFDNPLSLTMDGSGTQVLSGNNGYSAGTTLEKGVLQAASNTALGTGTISFTGGTLQYGTGITQDFSPQFSNAASQLYSVDTNGNNVTFASNLTSSGGSLTKLGAGTLTLSGANTYDGGTDVQAGTLQAGADNTLSSASAYTVENGATLDLNNHDESIGSVAGLGNLTFGSGTLTTGGDGTSTVFAGAISGTGGLTKVGGGAFLLSGPNNYRGPTTIAGGAIELGNSNAIPSNSAIHLTGGALDLNGNSAGYTSMLTVAGAGSTLDFGAGHSGGMTLQFADSSIAAWTSELDLINFTVGTDELSFTDSIGLTSAQLEDINLAGYQATGLNYLGDVQFQLDAVPEPTVTSLLVFGFALLALTTYKRRRLEALPRA